MSVFVATYDTINHPQRKTAWDLTGRLFASQRHLERGVVSFVLAARGFVECLRFGLGHKSPATCRSAAWFLLRVLDQPNSSDEPRRYHSPSFGVISSSAFVTASYSSDGRIGLRRISVTPSSRNC
jgi:hypothetical protein